MKPPEPPSGALHGLDPGGLFDCALEDGSLPSGKKWEPPMVEEIARLLPQFAIEECLGRGGMGAVYRGRQAGLDRGVAIKVLPIEMASDPEFEMRFDTEMKILAGLDHPHIVKVYESGRTTQGHLFFAMELVDGNLQKLLEKGTLPPELALSLTSQICCALKYAHERKLVHRDIKPANILITNQNEAKLADFGLARLMSEPDADTAENSPNSGSQQESDTGFTGSQMTFGTPPFASPEQEAGRVDHRSDIFALGVTLYIMLTGQVPPKTGAPPPSKAAAVDARIDSIVRKAIERELDRRYQKIDEMRADVDRVLSRAVKPMWLVLAGSVIAAAFTLFAGISVWKKAFPSGGNSSAFAKSSTLSETPKQSDATPIAFAKPAANESPKGWITAGLNEQEFGGWKAVGTPKLNASGELLTIAATGGRTGIVSGRGDFSKFDLHIEFSASADIQAWIGVRVAGQGEQWTGYTSSISVRDGLVALGHMGANFVGSRKDENTGEYEGGLGKAEIPPGQFLSLHSTIDDGDVVWTEVNGETTSGVKRQVPAQGHIGIFVSKGSLNVRKIEVRERVAPAAPFIPTPASTAPESGFASLLNEDQVADWKQCGPGGVTIHDGIATTWTPANTPPGYGLHWYSKRTFRDFILKLDFKKETPASNSGVFVRFPDPGDNPKAVYNTGSEIEINGSGTGNGATGALWFFKPPSVDALKPDDWNEYEITVIGNHYQVKLNGILVNERDGDKPLEGYIGLQNHIEGLVQFRNFRIKELPSPP